VLTRKSAARVFSCCVRHNRTQHEKHLYRLERRARVDLGKDVIRPLLMSATGCNQGERNLTITITITTTKYSEMKLLADKNTLSMLCGLSWYSVAVMLQDY
jgi:hypothetical protein